MYDYDDFTISYEVPTAEEEASMRKVLTPGDYHFSVEDVELTTSSKGDAMLVLKLQVFDLEGKAWSVRDWFVLTKNMAFKLKQFWVSVGHPENYGMPLKKSQFMHQYGMVKTDLRKGNDDNDYPSIKKYLPTQPKKNANEFRDDELPNFN